MKQQELYQGKYDDAFIRRLMNHQILETICKPQRGKEPLFGGALTLNGKELYITKVIYSNPATIVFWSDGTKTTSKCRKEDTYNPETGLALAVLKRLTSGDFVAALLEDWIVGVEADSTTCVTLKEVRQAHKAAKKDKE